MRSAAVGLAMLLLASCSMPTGAEPTRCDINWRGAEAVIVQPGEGEERGAAIECMSPIEDRRIRIGFRMPPGPDCHRLSRIEVVEGGDSVAITLFVQVSDDPTAGACADDPGRTVTEIDLAAPVGERRLLDGSR